MLELGVTLTVAGNLSEFAHQRELLLTAAENTNDVMNATDDLFNLVQKCVGRMSGLTWVCAHPDETPNAQSYHTR